jgi:hypothetical protein
MRLTFSLIDCISKLRAFTVSGVGALLADGIGSNFGGGGFSRISAALSDLSFGVGLKEVGDEARSVTSRLAVDESIRGDGEFRPEDSSDCEERFLKQR